MVSSIILARTPRTTNSHDKHRNCSAAKAAGLGSWVSPHTLRHSFATLTDVSELDVYERIAAHQRLHRSTSRIQRSRRTARLADSAASRLSASKNPSCAISAPTSNHTLTPQTPTAPSRRLFFEVPHNLGPRETATKMRHAPTGLAGDRISFELGVPTLQSTHNTLSKTIRAQSIELLNKHLATATDRHAQVKRAHCGPMRTKYHRDARAVRQCL